MFALRGGAQHGYVGHNDHIIFGAGGQIFAELVDLAQIVAQRAIVMLHNVYLFPRLAASGHNYISVGIDGAPTHL